MRHGVWTIAGAAALLVAAMVTQTRTVSAQAADAAPMSEQVFKNIQVLKGVPAGRIPLIMEKGFSDSLGVTCTFCHNPADWAAEPNHHMPIARQMWTMTQEINQRLLPAVKDLKNAQVNCTTCHRGQKKPALNLGPPPSQPQPQPQPQPGH